MESSSKFLKKKFHEHIFYSILANWCIKRKGDDQMELGVNSDVCRVYVGWYEMRWRGKSEWESVCVLCGWWLWVFDFVDRTIYLSVHVQCIQSVMEQGDWRFRFRLNCCLKYVSEHMDSLRRETWCQTFFDLLFTLKTHW
jgi:hypothetical protein